MACLLARTWSGSEATAIWFELVTERKKDIAENTDPSQIQSIPARVAAQQGILRSDLAMWDASARAWLLSADEVEKFNLTQLRLTIQDSGLLVGSIGSTYASVIEVWTVAMRTLQDLILGKPQRVSKGALLVGLSAWHIFPDLNVLGPIAHVRFNDSLVEKGGIITLGLQSTSPDEDPGVQWSLSLSHLRYYGEPVKVSTSLGPNSSRISMEDLQLVALGSVFESWGCCITGNLTGAEMIIAIVSYLDYKSECEFEQALPSLYLLWRAAKRLLDSSEVDRQSALCLMNFGRRRAKSFLGTVRGFTSPAFGLGFPNDLWDLIQSSKGKDKSIPEEIEDLRKFAELCGYSWGDCVVRYPRATVANMIPDQHSTVAYGNTTAIMFPEQSQERGLDSMPSRERTHIYWIPEASGSCTQVVPEAENARICEFYVLDSFDENSAHVLTGIYNFPWHSLPESFQNNSHVGSGSNNQGLEQNFVELCWVAGFQGRSNLFCRESQERRTLSDVEITKVLKGYDTISVALLSRLKSYFSQPDVIKHPGTVGVGEDSPLCCSLTRLARASSLYRQFPGATVSLSVVRHPMYDITSCYDIPVSLSAKFACIAFFETGSNAIQAEQLLPVMALCSGNSIYVANALIQDPIEPNLNVYQGITRIIGNIDHPGLVMFAPPQSPLVRSHDLGDWRLVNHFPFNGTTGNCFPETSLHLSFTKYEVPLHAPIGAMDAEISMMETLVSTYERKRWIADLDIIASLRNEK